MWIELMPCNSDTLVHAAIDMGFLASFGRHEGIFQLGGGSMVHRAPLRIVAVKKVVGVDYCRRQNVGFDAVDNSVRRGQSRGAVYSRISRADGNGRVIGFDRTVN